MIAFTICSNNYLPKARILGESILQHNPGIRFVIGLVDLPDDGIDYKALGSFEILPVQEIGIPEFEEMVLRYDLVDLNTAVKPFYFRYLFKRHAAERELRICYFDPDICVYANLNAIEEGLARAAVLLTPHVMSPIVSDGKHPEEHAFLAFGLYNLGFCAMRRSEVADKLLDWWSNHLTEDCRYDAGKGMFVDQAWMDLAPIFFEDVEIVKHPGFNVAYWNLHERQVELGKGTWTVNKQWPLVFYHFSDLAESGSGNITKTPTRFILRDRPELQPLFQEYHSRLADYDIEQFKSIPCLYVMKRTDWLHKERQFYYRRHPFRLLLAGLKRALPKGIKEFVRAS